MTVYSYLPQKYFISTLSANDVIPPTLYEATLRLQNTSDEDTRLNWRIETLSRECSSTLYEATLRLQNTSDEDTRLNWRIETLGRECSSTGLRIHFNKTRVASETLLLFKLKTVHVCTEQQLLNWVSIGLE